MEALFVMHETKSGQSHPSESNGQILCLFFLPGGSRGGKIIPKYGENLPFPQAKGSCFPLCGGRERDVSHPT